MSAVRPSAPPAVRWIVRTLEDAGYETWAVGGAVRDVLLGLPQGDWDLATRARPQDVRRLFRRTVPLGVEHGTVGVLARDGTMYEVTTFRRDVETDGRHAVVEFAERLDEDLARRDFTVNAIAWHPLRGELADPFGGMGDLEARVLRTVGRPEARFGEDYLRVLRALRFAGRFGLHIDEGTWRALCGSVDRLSALSAERVREELLKVLAADPKPSVSLDLYAASGVLAAVYPELEALRGRDDGGGPDAWGAALATVDALPSGRPLLRLAALLRDVEPREAAQLLMRLRLSKAQVDEVARRAAAAALPAPDAPDVEYRRWLSAVGPERLSAVTRLELAAARGLEARVSAARPDAVVTSWRRARAVLAERPPLNVGDLALDGRDLVRMGLRPGPRFGELLDELLGWVIDDPSRNAPERLEARVRELEGMDG